MLLIVNPIVGCFIFSPDFHHIGSLSHFNRSDSKVLYQVLPKS